MQLDIGGTTAKCFSCGSKEFEPLVPNAGTRHDRLACVHCSTEVLYEDLVAQIARAAIARWSGAAHHHRPNGRPADSE
jgi:hypothetical protein